MPTPKVTQLLTVAAARSASMTIEQGKQEFFHSFLQGREKKVAKVTKSSEVTSGLLA